MVKIDEHIQISKARKVEPRECLLRALGFGPSLMSSISATKDGVVFTYNKNDKAVLRIDFPNGGRLLGPVAGINPSLKNLIDIYGLRLLDLIWETPYNFPGSLDALTPAEAVDRLRLPGWESEYRRTLSLEWDETLEDLNNKAKELAEGLLEAISDDRVLSDAVQFKPSLELSDLCTCKQTFNGRYDPHCPAGCPDPRLSPLKCVQEVVDREESKRQLIAEVKAYDDEQFKF